LLIVANDLVHNASVFGWIKQVLGFRTFSMRGLRKVKGEWDLICLAVNLKRLRTLPTFTWAAA
jgi:deoxyribodipyrimidine photolyase-like uncharacterized protein